MKGKILLIGLILLSFFTVMIIITTKETNKINKEKDFDKTLKLINKLRYFNDKDETFDKIQKYYINLDRSPERRKGIEEEFKLYNIKNYERIPAVDGSKLENLSKGEVNGYTFTNDYNLKPNELGATLSHLIAIKKAYDKGYDYVIILEDDMKFTLMPYWRQDLSNIIEKTPKDFDILLLTHHDFRKIKNCQEGNIYKREELIHSACCYLVSRKGMENVNKFFFNNNNIELLKSSDLENGLIDVGIWKKLNTYYIYSQLFPLDSFQYKTTIHQGFDPSYFEETKKILENYEPLFWDKLLKKTS